MEEEPLTILGRPVVFDPTMKTPEIKFCRVTFRGFKRRGRPPLSDEPSERIDVRLPRSLYDALCSHALAADVSLPAVVRDAIDLFLSVKNRQPK